MDVLIAVVTGALVVIVLIFVNGASYVQSMKNLTGEKKSPFKAAIWLFVGLIHSYALIDLIATWGGADFTSVGGAPPSLATVYTGFVGAWITFITEFAQWLGGISG